MGRPSAPVCLVTSRRPSISAVAARTGSRARARLTPPALPRPPACTCAFPTPNLPPSFSAAAPAGLSGGAQAPGLEVTSQLDAARLAAATGMYLRLHHPQLAA